MRLLYSGGIINILFLKDLQPKIDALFNEIDNFASFYKSFEKENQNI